MTDRKDLLCTPEKKELSTPHSPNPIYVDSDSEEDEGERKGSETLPFPEDNKDGRSEWSEKKEELMSTSEDDDSGLSDDDEDVVSTKKGSSGGFLSGSTYDSKGYSTTFSVSESDDQLHPGHAGLTPFSPTRKLDQKELREGYRKLGFEYNKMLYRSFQIDGNDIIARSNQVTGGSFGIVIPCLWKNRGADTKVVVKIMKDTEKKSIEELFDESGFLFRCLHPNIVRIFGITRTIEDPPFDNRLGFVMEEMQMNVRDFLINHEKDLTGEDILETMIQMTKGLSFIHDRKVIHFDIKLNNYLVNFFKSANDERNEIVVKLTDFGISREITDTNREEYTTFGGKGTLNYMAPEVASQHRSAFGAEVDIFSLGVCFYRMFEGLKAKPVVKGKPKKVLGFDGKETICANWEFEGFHTTPTFMRDLIRGMLAINVDQRRKWSGKKVLRELLKTQEWLNEKMRQKKETAARIKKMRKSRGAN